MEHGDVSETELGFAGARVPVGTHICQIFSDDAERSSAMLKFLHKGLALREKTACFSEKLDEEHLRDILRESGLDMAALETERTFLRASAKAVYFSGGRFEPERMLGLITAFHQDSIKEGHPAARVIGEMEPDIRSVPGGDRLLEYEARVSVLLRQHPVTAMCQYDARLFDGATIMDVLRVHPMMVVRDMVVRNPFFIPPEEVLASRQS